MLVERNRRAAMLDHARAASKGPDNSYAGHALRQRELPPRTIQACWACTTNSTTTSSCRYCRSFPGFILQQVHNAVAVRQIVPRGVDPTDLNWTYLGYTDNSPELRRDAAEAEQSGRGRRGMYRWRMAAVGGFVQRGIAAAAEGTVGGGNGRGAAPRGRRRARPRHRCAGSGRRIACTWACDAATPRRCSACPR